MASQPPISRVTNAFRPQFWSLWGLVLGAGVLGLVSFGIVSQLTRLQQSARHSAAELEWQRETAERRAEELLLTMRREIERAGCPQATRSLVTQVQNLLDTAALGGSWQGSSERHARLALAQAEMALVRDAPMDGVPFAREVLRLASTAGTASGQEEWQRMAAKAECFLGEAALWQGDCREAAVRRADLAAQRLSSLAESASTQIVLAKVAALRATVAARMAEDSAAQDRLARDLATAQIKRKSAGLSERLRAEMKDDFQRREKLLQEAQANNDPQKLSAAMAAKESFDQKFSAELKKREEQLKQEGADVMKPRADAAENRRAAVEAWTQAVQAAVKCVSLAAADAELGTSDRWVGAMALIMARTELSAALALQEALPEALDSAEKAAAEAQALLKEDPASSPAQDLAARAAQRLAEAKFLQGFRLAPDQAKPLWQQAETHIRQAVEAFELSYARCAALPTAATRLGQSRSTLSALLGAQGRKEESAAWQKLASEVLPAAHPVRAAGEALGAVLAKLSAARQQLQQMPTEDSEKLLQASAVQVADLEELLSLRTVAAIDELGEDTWRSKLASLREKYHDTPEVLACLDKVERQ